MSSRSIKYQEDDHLLFGSAISIPCAVVDIVGRYKISDHPPDLIETDSDSYPLK